MANIKQVAAEAGLSVACVSKYLKNPDSVLPLTREKIEAAVAKLQYVPSPAARSLRTKRSNTIKIVMESIKNPFYAELFEELRTRLEEAGYTAVLQNIEHPLTPVDLQAVDGVIVGFADDDERLTAICRTADQRPVVCLHGGELRLPIPAVWLDVGRGMKLAVGHHRQQGCRTLAYVGGPPDNPISTRKLDGVLRAAEEAGLTLAGAAIHHGAFTFQHGYDSAKSIVQTGPLPDGIVCENDVLAAGVICGLYRQEVRVPQDVHVTGFDNLPLADMYIPAITSVAMPLADMCREAVRMLAEALEGGRPDSREFMPALAVRMS